MNFAGTTESGVVSTMLAVCASRRSRDWEAITADVSQAFLNAELVEGSDHPVFVKSPAGEVWRLEKALYGLRAAPKAWQRTLRKIMLESKCWAPMPKHGSTFVEIGGTGTTTAHVDDLMICDTKETREGLLSYLQSRLKLTRIQ